MVSSYFSNIQNIIRQAIDAAAEEVMIITPWFTSRQLFNSLLVRLEENVAIHLVLRDDEVNFGSDALKFDTLIKAGCKLYTSLEERPIHSKYCIIDSKKVITGSYNWTFLAENQNYENILVIQDERIEIEKYVRNFREIVSEAQKLDADSIPQYDFSTKYLYKNKHVVGKSNSF